MDPRPPIPAEIKRKVLLEAGHRCAIPTCRYIETEIHHITPWETCQKHEYENLIALCANCHRRADRGEIDRKSLKLYKTNLRFLHDKFSMFEIDVLFECYKLTAGEGMPYMPQFFLLLKRVIENGYLEWVTTENQGGVYFGGVRMSNDYVIITEKGKVFVKEISIDYIGE